ncbi:hypothetical protein AAFF_G00217940 [Aldrovandia affinis]|uniref:Uncharacterized protein n=1 Tax=Aldrovandia affinis TaxID=143900 RepID=A0AAD7SW06_9TELE|nr:hypothetical protein AAFF_G00217940 [Aldrovandia affinis]
MCNLPVFTRTPHVPVPHETHSAQRTANLRRSLVTGKKNRSVSKSFSASRSTESDLHGREPCCRGQWGRACPHPALSPDPRRWALMNGCLSDAPPGFGGAGRDSRGALPAIDRRL